MGLIAEFASSSNRKGLPYYASHTITLTPLQRKISNVLQLVTWICQILTQHPGNPATLKLGSSLRDNAILIVILNFSLCLDELYDSVMVVEGTQAYQLRPPPVGGIYINLSETFRICTDNAQIDIISPFIGNNFRGRHFETL